MSVNNYYVGGTGASDDNPGTADKPFATIQKAADTAQAGAVVNIRAGTYRETVIPANSGTEGSPIIFQPDGDAAVTVSGADTADGGWSIYKDSIYQRDISLPVTGYNDHAEDNGTQMANQVFVDGKMMIEARWPNVSDSDDLLNKADFRDGKKAEWSIEGDQTLVDPEIPDIPGGWVGGNIWVNGWFISQTRKILYQKDNMLTLSGGSIDFDPERRFNNFYYLTGKLEALDAEKEWFYDGEKLYLRAPGSVIPANVEVKMRNYAFDLSGKSYITVKGISIFAATIYSDKLSSHITVDGINAKYISHYVTTSANVSHWPYMQAGNSHTYETGILLMGPYNTIKNSTISYSAGHGIVLGGADALAHNNLIHDISYGGCFECAIYPAPNLENNTVGVPQTITCNTAYRLGRSAIYGVYMDKEIAYNDFYGFGYLSNDVGAIYVDCIDTLMNDPGINCAGTVIHHNWLHDCAADERQGSGIYFDQRSGGGALVHHNVIWNMLETDAYSEITDGLDRTIDRLEPIRWYNNTFASREGPHLMFSWLSYSTDAVEDDFKNNIYNAPFQRGAWSVPPNENYVAGDNSLTKFTPALFAEPAAGDFRLLPGSPAMDAGIPIDGITDGFAGASPDLGAYEHGGEYWIPGYSEQRAKEEDGAD